MYVHKRDGRRESVHFDKITSRVSKLCYGLDSKVQYAFVARSNALSLSLTHAHTRSFLFP